MIDYHWHEKEAAVTYFLHFIWGEILMESIFHSMDPSCYILNQYEQVSYFLGYENGCLQTGHRQTFNNPRKQEDSRGIVRQKQIHSVSGHNSKCWLLFFKAPKWFGTRILINWDPFLKPCSLGPLYLFILLFLTSLQWEIAFPPLYSIAFWEPRNGHGTDSSLSCLPCGSFENITNLFNLIGFEHQSLPLHCLWESIPSKKLAWIIASIIEGRVSYNIY